MGQNFLIDYNIRDKIVSACQLLESDRVLEIGAGLGVLTEILARNVKSLTAVEIDRKLSASLKEQLREFTNTRIICADILKFKIKDYFKDSQKIKVIGNLPFYITTPVIVQLLEQKKFLDSIFIMVPKRVAQRFNALPGTKDYSAFTCLLKYHARPKILFHISRSAFKPMPKIDTSFIRLDILETAPVKVMNEELFFKIIRLSFRYRRKMLFKCLRGIITKEGLKRIGIDFRLRPEALTLEDFANLSNSLAHEKIDKISLTNLQSCL